MRGIAISVALLGVLCVSSPAALAAEDQAIKDRLAEFAAAWDKADTQAIAAMWAEDGTVMNPAGETGRGRAEVEKLFVKVFDEGMKGSRNQIEGVKVQWVTPDMAVADMTGNITNIKGQGCAAEPDYQHHVVWVFVKKDGKWMVAAARPYQIAK